MPFIVSPSPLGGDINHDSGNQSRMLQMLEKNAQRKAMQAALQEAARHEALLQQRNRYPDPEPLRHVFEPFSPSPPNLAFEQQIGHHRAPILASHAVDHQTSFRPYPEPYHQPSRVEQAYVDYYRGLKPSATETAEAFASWYTEQVVHLLIVPGYYRAGVGGSSDEIWGRTGREKREWEHLGKSSAAYPQPWGRMGMFPSPRAPRVRRPSTEKRDPWNVSPYNAHGRSQSLFNFVYDVVTRMSITPVALVAAVWYLNGLGLHECDTKGAELRALLRSASLHEVEGVEKRVAVIGLLLAGKWLDDNAFLAKSWTEVTSIPVKEIGRLERVCLRDYHHSLVIPLPAWVDHVNKLYGELIDMDSLDKYNAIVIGSLDDMVSQAGESVVAAEHEAVVAAQAKLDRSRMVPFYQSLPAVHHAIEHEALMSISSEARFEIERRVSLEHLPAAGEQAITRDWKGFVQPYASDLSDAEAERTVSRLVDDEINSSELEAERLVEEEIHLDDHRGGFFHDDDGEEYLEYDGAPSFFRRAPPLERSNSNSSARSIESHLLQAQYDSDKYPYSSPMATETPTYMDYKPYSSPSPDVYRPGYEIEPGVQIIGPPSKYGPSKCWGGDNPLAMW